MTNNFGMDKSLPGSGASINSQPMPIESANQLSRRSKIGIALAATTVGGLLFASAYNREDDGISSASTTIIDTSLAECEKPAEKINLAKMQSVRQSLDYAFPDFTIVTSTGERILKNDAEIRNEFCSDLAVNPFMTALVDGYISQPREQIANSTFEVPGIKVIEDTLLNNLQDGSIYSKTVKKIEGTVAPFIYGDTLTVAPGNDVAVVSVKLNKEGIPVGYLIENGKKIITPGAKIVRFGSLQDTTNDITKTRAKYVEDHVYMLANGKQLVIEGYPVKGKIEIDVDSTNEISADINDDSKEVIEAILQLETSVPNSVKSKTEAGDSRLRVPAKPEEDSNSPVTTRAKKIGEIATSNKGGNGNKSDSGDKSDKGGNKDKAGMPDGKGTPIKATPNGQGAPVKGTPNGNGNPTQGTPTGEGNPTQGTPTGEGPTVPGAPTGPEAPANPGNPNVVPEGTNPPEVTTPKAPETKAPVATTRVVEVTLPPTNAPTTEKPRVTVVVTPPPTPATTPATTPETKAPTTPATTEKPKTVPPLVTSSPEDPNGK